MSIDTLFNAAVGTLVVVLIAAAVFGLVRHLYRWRTWIK